MHYRHGQTNANKGDPMRFPDGGEVPADMHLTNTTGETAPEGTPWFAGNKLGDWVQLTPQARESATALQPTMEQIAGNTDFLLHSPVERAKQTMNLATGGVDNLPTPQSFPGLAERGVGGDFGYPKTDQFKSFVDKMPDGSANPDYKPPVEIPNSAYPWSQTPDVTGPETVNQFLGRMSDTADDLARTNWERGNGLTFSHQYSIAGMQDAQYKMTEAGPIPGMPEYGVYDKATNPNGFYDPMTAGHDIPNGATLARPQWVWGDETGKVNSVPAMGGFSDLKAPAPQNPTP
jgi:broad specificity phosphatase PhoE